MGISLAGKAFVYRHQPKGSGPAGLRMVKSFGEIIMKEAIA